MVLVTGATGILGRVIVLELLKRNKTVYATKRPTSNLQEVKKSFSHYTEHPDEFFNKIKWIDVDFNDLTSLKNALIGVEEVYHTAGKVSFNPKDEKEIYNTNVEATKNLLYACENSSVKKFCFISSIAVLDSLNENGELDENSEFNPKVHHSDYAISKYLAEMEVWRASAEGLNTVILNPGVIVGTGNWHHSSGELFSTFEKSPYTFSGGTAYVDVRDVAKIATELMDKNCFGERFVVISENEKYQTVAQIIRKKLELSEPKLISKKLLLFAKILRIPFGWAFPILKMANQPNIEAVTSFSKVSHIKIKERLGYIFVPVHESLNFHLQNYIKDKNK